MAEIEVVRDGAIRTVMLNRPHKLNALTRTMWRSLGDAFEALSNDETVRCVVIRGAGDRAFSPGNDIAEFQSERSNRAQAIEYGADMHRTARLIDACPHPVLAGIQGVCVGGGLEIAALADLRICGASSRFGAPIKNLGLVMAYPEIAPLVRLCGEALALEMLLEGRIIEAAEAQARGLVNRVVPDDAVPAEVAATAARIAAGAPRVARWHKTFVRRLRDPRPLTATEEAEAFECFDTADFREGYTAFLAKRAPRFEGR